MYGFGNSGATPGGRFGGALPDVLAMEFRVEGMTVVLVVRPSPRLLTLREEAVGAALGMALEVVE